MIWIFPTKNQSAIRKQKVMFKAFVCRSLLPYPHTEAYLQAPFTKVEIILLNASITIRQSKRDNRSPYLKLQELPKKPNEVFFFIGKYQFIKSVRGAIHVYRKYTKRAPQIQAFNLKKTQKSRNFTSVKTSEECHKTLHEKSV